MFIKPILSQAFFHGSFGNKLSNIYQDSHWRKVVDNRLGDIQGLFSNKLLAKWAKCQCGKIWSVTNRRMFEVFRNSHCVSCYIMHPGVHALSRGEATWGAGVGLPWPSSAVRHTGPCNYLQQTYPYKYNHNVSDGLAARLEDNSPC